MATTKSERSQFHRGAFYKEQYQCDARRILREAMSGAGLSCRDLARKLTERGLPHTVDGLATKISRGSFSAAFFLLCMRLTESRS